MVGSGGLYMLHGIVVAVEGRIRPYISKFISFLILAIKNQNTDTMGVRVACGLISDLGNHC